MKTLNEFDFGGNNGSGEKRNWKDYADGTIREAVQGEDFTCKMQSFAQQVRSWVGRKKKAGEDYQLAMRVDTKAKTVVFKITPPAPVEVKAETPAPAAKPAKGKGKGSK